MSALNLIGIVLFVALLSVCIHNTFALRPSLQRISSRSSSSNSRHGASSLESISHSSSSIRRNRHHQFIMMAARSGGGGSTKLDRKTSQQTSTKPSLRDEIEKDWRLILHDDSVHTIQQVCEILTATCPLCAGPRAYEVTLEVHMTGAGTVAVANKKIIDEYCKSLQTSGLSVSMAPDDEFEGEDDLEE